MFEEEPRFAVTDVWPLPDVPEMCCAPLRRCPLQEVSPSGGVPFLKGEVSPSGGVPMKNL